MFNLNLSTFALAVLASGVLAAPSIENRQAPAADAAPLTDPVILNVGVGFIRGELELMRFHSLLWLSNISSLLFISKRCRTIRQMPLHKLDTPRVFVATSRPSLPTRRSM